MMCLSSCSDCAARAACAWRDGWFSQRGIGSHMIEPKNPILSKMLDRLFVTLMDGPSMNCKPHASRQRLDFVQIERLKDKSAGEIFLSVLRNKLRLIAEDARTYEQDTGVHALNLGFPIISLPPGTFGARSGVGSRRVLAPIAFIPMTIVVKAGSKQAVDLARFDKSDVVPN